MTNSHLLTTVALVPLLVGVACLFLLLVVRGWRNSLLARNWQLDVQAREMAIKTAERIREEKAFSEAVMQGLPAIVCIVDKKGSFLRWNTQLETMLGYSSTEVSQISVLDTLAPEHQESIQQTIRQVMEAGTGDAEVCLLTKTGKEISCYILGVRLMVKGEPCLLGVAMDIEKRKRAEEELRKSRTVLANILDSVPQSIFWKDREGLYLGCNAVFARAAGLPSPEAIIGRTDFDLPWARAEAEAYRADDAEVIRHNRAKRHIVEPLQQADGSRLWIDTTKIPLTDQTGVYGVLGVFDDITERRRAEAVLRESEEQFRQLAENVREVFFILTPDPPRTTYISPAFEHVFGKSRQEVYERSEAWLESIHPEDRERVGGMFAECMQGLSTEMEFRALRPDGSVRVVHGRSFPVHDSEGRFLRAVGVAEDITDRKSAENALRVAHSESELFFNSVPSILIGLDAQGRISRWNLSAESTFGVPAASVRGKQFKNCGLTWLRADAEAEMDSWLALSKPRSCDDLPFEKDGTKHYLSLTILPVKFASGEQAGLLITGADVTERIHLEQQLRQAQKLEAIGQLAAGIAHEINTPTQYVSDNVAFLKESWHPVCDLFRLAQTLCAECAQLCNAQETMHRVKQCLDAADVDYLLQEIPHAIDESLQGLQHIAKIVRCMKEFSHPDSSRKAMVDINRAIETTITIARNEWKYVAEMVTDFDPSLPHVSCFVGEFNQVILNLIVNAADAIRETVAESQKGKITIATCQRDGFVEVRISDTGGGIPEKIRSRIFEPFFTTKGIGKGSGQGLALAHSVIVKKHAGKIWFETETGKGTTFFVRLPCAAGTCTRGSFGAGASHP